MRFITEELVRKVADDIAERSGCIRCIACSCEDPCENTGFAEMFMQELERQAS